MGTNIGTSPAKSVVFAILLKLFSWKDTAFYFQKRDYWKAIGALWIRRILCLWFCHFDWTLRQSGSYLPIRSQEPIRTKTVQDDSANVCLFVPFFAHQEKGLLKSCLWKLQGYVSVLCQLVCVCYAKPMQLQSLVSLLFAPPLLGFPKLRGWPPMAKALGPTEKCDDMPVHSPSTTQSKECNFYWGFLLKKFLEWLWLFWTNWNSFVWWYPELAKAVVCDRPKRRIADCMFNNLQVQ